jgi:type I restriction enzyme R subunit
MWARLSEPRIRASERLVHKCALPVERAIGTRAMNEPRFFDPKQGYAVAWKTLPHWAQSGTVCFITWRTLDSLPASAQERISAERRDLLIKSGLDPNGAWKSELESRSYRDRGRIQWQLFALSDRHLDAGAGACVLARPEISLIVEQSLKHFDGVRYILTDYVVMPNHVHLLVAFGDEAMLLTQCTSWKRFTATEINRTLRIDGDFWQPEQFDHLVRGPEQFEYFRRYIADNPRKACLPAVAYRHFSKLL